MGSKKGARISISRCSILPPVPRPLCCVTCATPQPQPRFATIPGTACACVHGRVRVRQGPGAKEKPAGLHLLTTA